MRVLALLVATTVGLVSGSARGDEGAIQKKTHVYKTIGKTKIQVDVYRPDDGKVRPVVVWIHGGALILGSRASVPKQLLDLCRAEGYALVSLDYRLAPEVKLPDIISDIEDAFRWLRTKGPKLFAIDPDRIVVAGGSAGGYLTLMTGFRVAPRPKALVAYWGYGDVDGEWYTKPSEFYRKQSLVDKDDAFKGVGGAVLTGTETADQQKARGKFYLYLRQNGLWTKVVTGFDPKSERRKLDKLCPVRNVTVEYPPTLLIHGTKDTDVPYELSAAMAAELARKKVPHELVTVKGAGHGLAGGDKKLVEDAHERAAAFIRKHLNLKRTKTPSDETLEPWASNRHPKDFAGRHTEDITTAKKDYRVKHGGTMDGTNCRSPIGGSFGVWDQSWESNRAVRMENVGDTEVINPWLSNGRNDFRTLKEMAASALRPGMTDRDKAIALWRLQTMHRFHATTGDAEVNDPIKAINVYGYTTCGDDSICLAGLWKTAGFKVRPARVVGHCITQVHFNGRWNLLDGDMGPFFLLRDNVTIASEQDIVRDHDLLKRTHTHGILDADSRGAAEWSAALFIYEGNAGGDRNSARDTTMNMVLRPNEALVWRWGHRVPLKYHGRTEITVWGQRAAERVCNGLWEYRPDFAKEAWRIGADTVANIRVQDGALVSEQGKKGVLIWKMRSPYVFVGGRLEVEGSKAKFSISWDGKSWQEVGKNLDALFPTKGPARYEYQLRCELPEGARLKRLAIVNDLQMAPLALPEMVVGENRFTYTDQTTGPRRVRLTHTWVERSVSRPPGAPPAPVFPADEGRTDGTDIVFQWRPAVVARSGDQVTTEKAGIADYHFELSDRPDMAWPLSSNFSKLVRNTADRGKPRYTVPYTGLLTPGREYYWRVRARNTKGVWGPWSKTWSFIPGGPAQPVEVTLEPAAMPDGGVGRPAPSAGKVLLRWKPNAAGTKPVKYRVYGSDEKGFSVSDEPYRRTVGQSKDLPAQAPANFVAETTKTELVVLGAGLDLPNANKAFYRVMAVDDKGKRSGPSDYAAAPRPFICSKPPEAAKVGKEFRYQVSTVRSLGDLRLRIVDGKEVASFWEIERPQFVLVQGPKWIRIDEGSGVLRGVPDAAGNADVVVKVTLERSVRRLDEGRLSWGLELVKEVVTEKVGSATQRFRIRVSP
jgi:acetyl esterase/lipase